MSIPDFIRSLKKSVAVTVCAAFVLTPLSSVRAENTSDDREPASIPRPFTNLTEKQEKAIRRSYFETAVTTSKMVKTHRDFNRYYLTGLASADKATLNKRLAEIPEGPLPTMRVDHDQLVVDYKVGSESVRLRIRWPDVRKTIYYVNGVQFVYNPGKPLVPQLDFLLKQMAARKTASLMDLFIDSASAEDGGALLEPLGRIVDHGSAITGPVVTKDAAAAISAAEAAAKAAKQSKKFKLFGRITLSQLALTAGTVAIFPKVYETVGVTFIDLVESGTCWALDKTNGTGYLTMCVDMKKAAYDKKAKNNPSGLLTKEQVVMARFEESHFNSCPDNEDGKPRILAGQIRATGFDGDKKSFEGEWENFRAVWGPDGKPQNLIVVPTDTDPSKPITDPKKQHHVTMSLGFDGEGLLHDVTVPDDNWTGTTSPISRGPTKTLMLSQVLNPDEVTAYEKAKDVLFITLTYARKCTVEKAQIAIDNDKSPTKAPVSPATTTGTSVAPIPTVQ